MKVFRAANLVWTLLFVYAAAVQYNDPDPFRWMFIYGAAALASARAALMQRPGWFLPTLVGSVAIGWGATLLPHVLAHPPPGEALVRYRMLNLEVEGARELLGLSLTALWMAVLAIVHRPRPRPMTRS